MFNSVIKVAAPLALCAVLFGYFFFFKSPTQIGESDILYVGTNVGYAPYIYADDAGLPQGHDVDLMNAIGSILDKKIEWVDMGFDAVVIALQQKKVDCIIGGFSISDEKKKVINMIQYTQPQPLVLYFWKQIPEGINLIQDLEKLENPVVTLQTGSIGYEKYLRQFSFIDIKMLDGYAEVIMDLRAGKTLAGCCDLTAAIDMKRKEPNLQIMVLEGTEKLFYGDGIGVHKENKLLVEQLEQAVAQLEENGTLYKLKNQWLKKEV
jgi:ABC-type amino acid transport substrate-binding protein